MGNKTIFTSIMLVALAAAAVAQTKISGTSQCAKPDPQHMIQVGDHPNHAYAISQSKCTWTKPYEVGGTQAKDDVVTAFDEINGDKSRNHGLVSNTMANGDKAHVSFQGTATLKDGAPQTSEGKWRFTSGTGKLKGIKGSGTYKGKGSPDGVTFEIEGEYTLPSPK